MTERRWYAPCAVIIVAAAGIEAYTPLGIAAWVGYLFASVVAGGMWMMYEFLAHGACLNWARGILLCSRLWGYTDRSEE